MDASQRASVLDCASPLALSEIIQRQKCDPLRPVALPKKV